MAGRVMVLVAALLVAVLGAVLVFLWADRTVESAQAELDPVGVLVASDVVPEGTSVAQAVQGGLLELADRPRNALPVGYLEGIEDAEERVTTTPIFPGEILSDLRLVNPEDSDVLDIEDQDLAITIPLEDPNRVASFVEPTDQVAVFLTLQDVTADPEGGTGGGLLTRLLLTDVTVIGVGSRTSPGVEPTDDTSQTLVTLSVSRNEAERLIHAQSLGSLYLGLLDDESVITGGGGVTRDSLFQDVP